MRFYEYEGNMYTINDLSEISGVEAATIRARLRRGQSIESAVQSRTMDESVKGFCESSFYQDWIGMSTSYLQQIYWKWCVSHGYTPLHVKGFTRYVMQMYPNLKTVPTRTKTGCCRIIRER